MTKRTKNHEAARIIAKLAEAGLIVRVNGKWVPTETGKAVLDRQGVEPN